MNVKHKTTREAERLQTLGLRVFPVAGVRDGACTCGQKSCRKPGKHPLLRWKREATDDPRQVLRWWKQWPEANLAICTGEGLVVVDVDDPGIAESLRQRVPNETPVVRTSRGLHLYFAGEAPSRVGVREHIDVRGSGGYVIVPPSRHVSGTFYEWDRRLGDEDLPALPAVVVDMLAAKPAASGELPVPLVADGLAEGSRNDGLFRLASSWRVAGALDEELPVMLRKANSVRCSPPLERDEVDDIVRSVIQYPVGRGIAPSARTDQALLEFDIRPYPLAAYLALRSFADSAGTCFPSYETIAERGGMSRQAAFGAVQKLDQVGLIRVERRKDTSNLYTVIDPLTGAAIGGSMPSPDGAWEAVMEAEDPAEPNR